jgi:voltage-gated potassium channel
MEDQNSSNLEETFKKDSRKHYPIRNLFLLDVLRDHDSRPALFYALGTLVIGTLFYHWVEGWNFLDSIYFCVVSLGTVGYGDFTPKTPIGKIFTIVYLINGIVILLALFDRIRLLRSKQLQRPVNLE